MLDVDEQRRDDLVVYLAAGLHPPKLIRRRRPHHVLPGSVDVEVRLGAGHVNHLLLVLLLESLLKIFGRIHDVGAKRAHVLRRRRLQLKVVRVPHGGRC